MPYSTPEIVKILMHAREKIVASIWVVIRDTHLSEDIFQNTVVKAITKDVTFRSEPELLSWAFTTAKREGIDHLRKNNRELNELPPEVLDLMIREWVSEPIAHSSSRVDALHDCIESLPELSRKLLRLRYGEGMTCLEVAERLNAGANAIYKRLSRLHESLKVCVETRLEEPGL